MKATDIRLSTGFRLMDTYYGLCP